MNDDSGCLFGSWTQLKGESREKKSKIALLEERGREMAKFSDPNREKWCVRFDKGRKLLMHLVIIMMNM